MDLSLYSTKHQALYIYLTRLLKPIWDLSIISTFTRNTNFVKEPFLKQNLESNYKYLEDCFEKLKKLFDFIKQNTASLCGQYFHDKDHLYGSSHLSSHYYMVCELNNQRVHNGDTIYKTIELVEVSEKTSYKNLTVFLERILGIMEFLKITCSNE